MKRGIFIILALFLLAFLSAQEKKIELFGYFEPQVMGTKVGHEFYLLNANKLRLDIKSKISEKVTFAANVNFITYHGKTQWNILDFLSSSITDSIPQEMKALYVLPFSNRIYLDNAFLKIAFKYFDLTLGKQQISLGTGYMWNPIDAFNIKDMLDPTYEQPGHNALRLDLPLGKAATFTALYSADDSWKNSAKLIQIKTRILHFDIALVAIEKVWRFHDYTQFDTAAMNFLELPEKRQLLGASLAGQLLGIGLWAEYASNKMESTDDFYELVVGADYTFAFQTYIMVEFYRSSQGKIDYLEYDLNDWMRMLTSEQKTIARDQIYLLVQHPVSDLSTLGVSSIYCISDKSLILLPTFQYNPAKNMEITAYLSFNFGREGKVFVTDMGNGVLIRARVYF